jgi:hypothetical protein
MGERTIAWLIYTCLIGLIPVISRVFIWSVSKSGIEPIAISDLVAFGLVLHASNIHMINAGEETESRLKIVHNGLSVLFLVIYSIILMATVADIESIDYSSLRSSTLILCVVSFALSFSIFYERNAEEKVLTERGVS